MSPAFSVAATLSPAIRQAIGIEAISRTLPISHLADKHQVRRKFFYQQGNQAQQALDESFAPSQGDDDVLFHLPVTKNWLYQLILGLVLICHSSYRGVVELLCDLFDTPISIGTVHNRLQTTAEAATALNQTQHLSSITVGLQDEVSQADKPVLVGADAASTYCYLLEGVEHRDEATWGCHLLGQVSWGDGGRGESPQSDPESQLYGRKSQLSLTQLLLPAPSLGDSYLSLLQYFINHRCFVRSQVPERVGKSPKQLLTGEAHPHWLELLGFKRFQRA